MSLVLKPAPSFVLITILLAAHGGAIILVCTLPLPNWCLMPAAALICANFWWIMLARLLRITPGAITTLKFAGQGDWTVATRGGESHSARLASETFVHPQLVILVFALESRRRRTVVLWRDSLADDEFRKLCVASRLR